MKRINSGVTGAPAAGCASDYTELFVCIGVGCGTFWRHLKQLKYIH